MRRRVVVTGLGSITSLGHDIPTLWRRLLAGESGVGPITRFDAAALPTRIASEVKDFDPSPRLDAKLVRRTDRFTHYALWSCQEAVADARLDFAAEDRSRVGVIIGSGMGGLEVWEREFAKFVNQGPGRVSPFLIPMMIPDMAAGQVSISYGLRGPNFCTTSACASGAHAIGESFRLIGHGNADVMLTGGSEAPLTAFCVAAFSNMQALSRRNDEPPRASRPFDKDRDGFVIAEGAGIVILEELEHAQRRGAPIYGELVGYGATGDGYHMTAPAPEGLGAAEAMQMALADAGLAPRDVDYINAHGTSTDLNDVAETQAIKKVFGDHARRLCISSTKSMLGHLLGAAGAVEFIVCALSVRDQKVHATLNLEQPDPECDLDYVPGTARDCPVRAALTNSLGFGGHNATLLVRRFA